MQAILLARYSLKYGVTDRFVTPEQTNSAMVDIFVPVPIGSKFRMSGATTNGAWANTDTLPDSMTGQRKHVLSKRFTIDILKRYDTNIAVSEDEVEGVGAASLNESFEQICRDQIEQDIAINVNGYTFAAQLYAFFTESFSADATAAEVAAAIEAYTYDATNRTAAVRAFKLSNAKVSRGDSKLYAGYFPADKRQAFIFDTTFLVDLTDSVALNASDVASRMLAGGGMNAFTNEKKTVADYEKGYVGWLDGMPLYEALQQVKDATWYYLGLDASTDATVIGHLDKFVCLIAPANATLRALRPTSFKTVDDPDAQGVIIQPKVNMGVRCLSGNSLKCVYNGSAANALTAVKAIRAAIAGKFKLPNLSYDEDLPVAAAGSVTSTAQGTVTKA